MSKVSRGAARYTAGKKKAKKRAESRTATQPQLPTASVKPAQPQEKRDGGSAGTVLQFRPKAGSAVGRSAVAKAAASAKAVQQAVDYSYVYTDLKVIACISAALLGGLIALAFVIH